MHYSNSDYEEAAAPYTVLEQGTLRRPKPSSTGTVIREISPTGKPRQVSCSQVHIPGGTSTYYNNNLTVEFYDGSMFKTRRRFRRAVPIGESLVDYVNDRDSLAEAYPEVFDQDEFESRRERLDRTKLFGPNGPELASHFAPQPSLNSDVQPFEGFE